MLVSELEGAMHVAETGDSGSGDSWPAYLPGEAVKPPNL